MIFCNGTGHHPEAQDVFKSNVNKLYMMQQLEPTHIYTVTDSWSTTRIKK